MLINCNVKAGAMIYWKSTENINDVLFSKCYYFLKQYFLDNINFSYEALLYKNPTSVALVHIFSFSPHCNAHIAPLIWVLRQVV